MKNAGKAPLRAAAALIATIVSAPALAAPAASPAHGPAPVPRALRVGVLPDADSLPLLVAKDEGLFGAEGTAAGTGVELVPFKTAVERDSALQAGAIDGAVSDLIAVALATQAGFEIKATSLTDGRYGIVLSPASRIASLSELAEVPIGVSSNTIIQYAAETMIRWAGVGEARIRSLAVPKIQLRMELLLAGQLEAACLPEPLLSAARAKGARLLAASDDAALGRGLSAGVIVFSKAALEQRAADIALFYRAYWRAAQAVNARPDAYRDFLVDKALFPAETRDSFRFIVYEKPRLPSQDDIASVLAWMRGKGLLTTAIDGASLVDGRAIALAAASGGADGGW
jgi:NitT/TauT family transport system substrate-binding protein